MIPELGHFSLILSLCLAMVLASVPMWGSFRNHNGAMALAPSLAMGLLVFTAISFACLSWAFVNDDFSVKLVASHSNSLMPIAYKFSAVWGNHEGSLLLWALILSMWTAAVALFSADLPMVVLSRVLSVMGIIAVGFLLFSLLTSNPFERLLPGVPADGSDLNPLLQDPGLVIHPPLLYLGYVGFSVAFAFAIAALLGGRLDAAWAKWSRPWTNAAWAFLTLGIMLGSWWAYYELGWGGWWFWDPVENASFMPWLAGTALVHSLAVTEKRGLFKSWTVLLAIFAFSLSLLGTFLVRSGVLTSVHAFATDPARGVFILAFLAVVVGGSLTLYALRAPAVQSRIGLGQGKYSVGPPYFNAVFLPLMAVMVPFMGIGPISRWKRDQSARWRAELLVPALSAIVVGGVFPVIYGESFNVWVALAVVFASWLLFSLLRDVLGKLRNASSIRAGLQRLPPSYYAMQIAHLGFAVAIVGVVLTSQYNEERDMKMSPGEEYVLAGYRFSFDALEQVRGANYVADQAAFTVYRGQQEVVRLFPEKRRYLASGQVMTEASIDAGVFRDLFVAMGEPIGDGAWAIRLHYKPFIRWIWGGAILMACGGFLTLADRRYRRYRSRASASLEIEGAASGTA
jgi:cytochrome c-type biogenesis protein CcmF